MARTKTAPAPRFATREEWLTAAVEAMRPMFAAVEAPIPALRVSVGWPGGRGRKNAVIGQCWSTKVSADAVSEVFISPVLDDPAEVLATLVHEIVHAWDDCQSGHRGAFAKTAKALGLTGKMTATVAGEDLKASLAEIAADLGPFPHARLRSPLEGGADGPKKQGTRMLKVECAGNEDGEGASGYKVRMTRQWLDTYGTPACPCHGTRMVEAS